jgi:hypothetical protein
VESKLEIKENVSDSRLHLKEIELYGGAIRCSLPTEFMDTSTLRPVPDNQEVWLGPQADEGCFIMDILSLEEEADKHNPLPFFFNDLAQHNSVAEGKSCLCSNSLNFYKDISYSTDETFEARKLVKGHSNGSNSPQNQGGESREAVASIHTGVGFQCVSSSPSTNMALIPLPFAALDIKTPSWIRLEMCVIRLEDHETDILLTLSRPFKGNPADDDESKGEEPPTTSPLFESIWKSFVLVDWSLFA